MELHTPDHDTVLAEALQAHSRLAVDTEFMRERTYYAQLCLVQVATPEGIYGMDPLADGNFGASWDTLLERQWVLHSGRQDIEVIYQATERMPHRLFDTQIAMSLLGYAPQLGYAALVKELFDTELPKSQTRADWSKRPLSDAMLKYAAEDVEYLLPAHDLLMERLETLGRTDWAEQDSMQLLERSLYDIDTDSAVDRLKGAGKLRGRPRRAAVALATWREQRALNSNRPRRWILKDTTVIDLATNNPKTESALDGISDLPPATAKRHGRELLALLDATESGSDSYVPPASPDDREKALLKALQSRVSAIAADLNVAAEIIAPRKELVAVIHGQRQSRLFTGWRQEHVTGELLNVIDSHG